MQRQPYEKPTITLLGTLSDLTEAGHTHPGSDFMVYKDGTHGSVIPGSPGGDT